MPGSEGFSWTSASRTDVGNVRKVNEDALLDLSANGLWVVADGMGGHAAGDVASQMLVGKLGGVDSHDRFSQLVTDIEERVLEVNRRLFEMSSREDPPRVIGTTLAALVANGRHAVAMWVGDSRVYRLRDGEFRPITKDHSEVNEMIEQGILSEEEALDHPAANVVTRAVGGLDSLYVDVDLVELKDRDRFLICSDGLFKDVSEREMARMVGEGSCVDASDALIETTLEREAPDNVTVIVVEFREADE